MSEFYNKIKYYFREAFIATIPVLSGYIVMGISFGMLAVNKGYGIPYVLLMSIGIYAGSMQFVAIDLLSTNATIITAIVMTLFINLRHLFYGISILAKYKKFKYFRNYCIFSLTDETFSLVCNDKMTNIEDENAYCFTISILDHMYWITGSFIGAVIGRFIPQNIKGLDFSMTALFIVIVVSQWEKQKNHISAIIGFVVPFICLLIFGTQIFIIPSMIIMTIIFLLFKNNIMKRMNN